jgi:hemolysin III
MGVKITRDQTIGEEIANSITHGIGWVFGISALVLLIVFSSMYGDPWYIVSCTIYGVGLVLMYANSTMYHSLQGPRVKKVFKILDHCAIYFLIAATYTPYTLTILRGPWGWTLFGIVWGGFILGSVFKAFSAGKFKWVSVVIYIALGWCVLLAIGPLIRNLPYEGLILLLAGGICYSLGALIYAKKGVKYSHAVWHLYVLLGSIFHFFSVFFYVIPQ